MASYFKAGIDAATQKLEADAVSRSTRKMIGLLKRAKHAFVVSSTHLESIFTNVSWDFSLY